MYNKSIDEIINKTKLTEKQVLEIMISATKYFETDKKN
jgi:hypothetical protein